MILKPIFIVIQMEGKKNRGKQMEEKKEYLK